MLSYVARCLLYKSISYARCRKMSFFCTDFGQSDSMLFLSLAFNTQIISLLISCGPEHHVRCPIIPLNSMKNLYYSIIGRKFHVRSALKTTSIYEAILDALDKPNCQLAALSDSRGYHGEQKNPLCAYEVARSCLTLCDLTDCSWPGSRIPEAMGSSRQDYWSGLPCL